MSFRDAGNDLWSRVTSDYELRPDELRVLTDACHAADLIESMQALLSSESLLADGSMGQMVVNPLVSELRMQRTAFAQLVRQLKLPDSPAAVKASSESRSTQAREAANTRWSRRGA